MKSLGVYYRWVKIQQYGYMEQVLKHITFYVQNHRAPQAMCYNPLLVRDKMLGVPAFVKLIYFNATFEVKCASNFIGVLTITID